MNCPSELIMSHIIIRIVLLVLVFVAHGFQAQELSSMQKKWEHWTPHPINSFFRMVPDTASVFPNTALFLTRGRQKGAIHTSYPLFSLGKDSLSVKVQMKYRVKNLRNLLLTFHTIGYKAEVMKADTIILPLTEDWTEREVLLPIKRLFSLEIAIEAEGDSDNEVGEVFIADINVSSDGCPFNENADDYSVKPLPSSCVEKWDNLLSSPVLDKKILAIGETVHGTQTFSDIAFELMKERILHHNCKLIVLELPLSLSLYLNRYVQNDSRYTLDNYVTFYEPLTSMKFSPFLEWLKEYNANHNNEVSVLGFDGEAFTDMIWKMAMYDYLEPANADGSLSQLCYDMMFNKDKVQVDDSLVSSLFSDNEAKLIQCSLNNIRQYQQSRLKLAHRDEKMSELIQVLTELYLKPNTTATIYGHFMHTNYIVTSIVSSIHNSPSMGNFLKQKYNNDYLCVALSAIRGSAWFADLKGNTSVNELQEAPTESLEYMACRQSSDSLIYLAMDNLDEEVFKQRFVGINYVPNQFIWNTPKVWMDGMMILGNAIPINKDCIQLTEFDNILTERYRDLLKRTKSMMVK